MFKNTYHCSFNSSKDVITLSPTRKTIAKSLAPSLATALLGGVFWVVLAAIEEKQTSEFVKNNTIRLK